MPSWREFLFGEEEPVPKVTPKVRCAKCKLEIVAIHCESKGCGWWYCGSCGVMTEALTGRTSRYYGPRRA